MDPVNTGTNTIFLVTITCTSSSSTFFHHLWLRYVDARLFMLGTVHKCFSPSTHFLVIRCPWNKLFGSVCQGSGAFFGFHTIAVLAKVPMLALFSKFAAKGALWWHPFISLSRDRTFMNRQIKSLCTLCLALVFALLFFLIVFPSPSPSTSLSPHFANRF